MQIDGLKICIKPANKNLNDICMLKMITSNDINLYRQHIITYTPIYHKKNNNVVNFSKKIYTGRNVSPM